MIGRIWKLVVAIINLFKKTPPIPPSQPYVTGVSFGETEDGKPTKIVIYSDGRVTTSVIDDVDPTDVGEFLESLKKKEGEK